MSFDPSFLDATDAAFLQPRMLFDDSIVDIQDMGEYKKICYDRSKVQAVFQKHYPKKSFEVVEDIVKNAENLLALV